MNKIAASLVKKPLEMLSQNPSRLWSMVEVSNGCWEWKGRINKFGYGQISIGNTEFLAHRAAYFLSNGKLDTELCVMHTCDNPKCCNPSHLKAGTHAENMADMKAKGRRKGITTGDKNGRSKLNKLAAEKIRELKSSGAKLKDIAIQFGVGISTVSRVCRKENWI